MRIIINKDLCVNWDVPVDLSRSVLIWVCECVVLGV